MKSHLTLIGNTIIFICLIALLGSCRKSNEPDPVPDVKGEQRPVGTAIGAAVTKIIGPEGGVLSSPDQALRITVPAGAVPTATSFSIQPITNTNLAHLGLAFRLLPHGAVFQKPVSIIASYASLSDSIHLPQALGLAYQDSTGVWQFAGGSVIDTVQKTVTYQSDHFSDWSLMPWLMLKPAQAELNENEELTLAALRFIPFEKCNCIDDQLVPMPKAKPYPVGEPQPLDRKYIGKWDLAGPGTLVPTTTNEAVYKAPASILTNYTAAVSLQLKSEHALILVSNIQLRTSSWFEMRINGGAWKTHDAAAFQLEPGKCGISFVDQPEALSMFFPSGKGTYHWDGFAGNHLTSLNYWPNGTATAYVPYYEKDLSIYDSDGAVQITEYGNVGGYITGTFRIAPAGYFTATTAKQLGTATIEARFHLKRAR